MMLFNLVRHWLCAAAITTALTRQQGTSAEGAGGLRLTCGLSEKGESMNDSQLKLDEHFPSHPEREMKVQDDSIVCSCGMSFKRTAALEQGVKAAKG
jgi:hypothetical protein